MESRIKILGHALHPMLIVFPLGLLATGVIFDIIYLIWGNAQFITVAYWMIAAGIIGGLLAAVPGWIDWFAIPSGTRAKSVGLLHGVGNVLVLLLFIGSWWLRHDNIAAEPSALGYALSFIGFGLAAVTGWLGGELVDRLGVGVDDGAHLNSPSSLSNKPASQNAAKTASKV
jgi:uncharacterized membrane protein